MPDEVVATVDRIWADKVMTSEAIKTYAETFGAVFAPSFGDEARAQAMPIVIQEACSSVDARRGGQPAEPIGIDCETMAEVQDAVARRRRMRRTRERRRRGGTTGRGATPPTWSSGLLFVARRARVALRRLDDAAAREPRHPPADRARPGARACWRWR